ncbi:MAG: NAD(P)/FAD-dependent oxidoreductase [Armatimonadota bacterium]|nr:NAD(P)/FAD-dependent oxidoreductase [Armatimonadota bacterium]MDR7444313.1 NAD(P)/FAD-dependent oxidoreductase [Armatimonadota bacterium]MDR7569696.1 NAD(P)/FAD-dependent oxidoreductase [Armatimonadota bacterium]MDR7614800.1 NAD(P)/FAD-dependent oxidoreductase [Armatimonadota bacterium]
MDADVLVVGAGPAGSSLAIHLRRFGWHVRLVDRAHFPRPKPCGEYLNPGAVRLLARLGLGARIQAAGVRIHGILLTGPDGTSGWAPFPSGFGLLVPRVRLDHLLVQEAVRIGAELLEGVRVDAAAPGSPPVVSARGQNRVFPLRARLVVGADGLHSAVARSLQRLRPPAHAYTTVGACFEGIACDHPRGDLHVGPGWYVGAALYGNGVGNVVAALPQRRMREARDPRAAFAGACAELPVLRRLMRNVRPVAPFACVSPLGFTVRRAWAPGILLVGDAAGTVDPMTGQGVYLALRSAELAAGFIDRFLRTQDLRALADYDQIRRKAFRRMWAIARILQWGVRRGLARRFMRCLVDSPTLASWLLGVVGGR